jgi:hypothetical protein
MDCTFWFTKSLLTIFLETYFDNFVVVAKFCWRCRLY